MTSALGVAERLELRSIADTIEIADGVRMPRLGLGTSQAYPGQVEREIAVGLDLGYRHIDTAAMYGNEHEIGAAVARSGVSRQEVSLATKVWNTDQGYQTTLRAFDASRRRLGVEYIDLYLIHWPQPHATAETWRAMEELLRRGEVRAIGVCNFMIEHLEELFQTAEVAPAVNQFELHPWMQRPELQDYCISHGITVQAWAPVMRGRASRVQQLVEIGQRHGKTGAQVSIRWILQKGFTTIPKSTHESRLHENCDVFDFELSDDEMATIDALDRSEHAR